MLTEAARKTVRCHPGTEPEFASAELGVIIYTQGEKKGTYLQSSKMHPREK